MNERIGDIGLNLRLQYGPNYGLNFLHRMFEGPLPEMFDDRKRLELTDYYREIQAPRVLATDIRMDNKVPEKLAQQHTLLEDAYMSKNKNMKSFRELYSKSKEEQLKFFNKKVQELTGVIEKTKGEDLPDHRT